MVEDSKFKIFINHVNDVINNPSKENIKILSADVKNYTDLSKINCKYCKHFTNKVDNGGGKCAKCLFHYIRYSDNNFEKTPLNFELK